MTAGSSAADRMAIETQRFIMVLLPTPLSDAARRAGRRTRFGRVRPFVDNAVLDDDLDVREGDDVEERIAIDDDDVGGLTGLDAAEIAPADDLRVDACGRGDRAHRGHPHVDVNLDLAPQRLAVEVHR